MTLNILSLYKKTWPGHEFAVSFLHDSIQCEHCLSGKIHIAPLVKQPSISRNFDPPNVEDLSKSSFYKRHLKSFKVIEYDSIPENSFSSLGVKLTETVAAKLNGDCDLKVPKRIYDRIEKPKHFNKRKILRTSSKICNAENKDLKKNTKPKKTVYKDVYDNYFPSSKASFVKENKKCLLPLKKSSSKFIETAKEPCKGTLKRKRWKLEKLKQSNLNYEDDLFENQKFCNFKTMIEEDSDSDKYQEMRTPKINLSPIRDGSSSPSCVDCYSPGELLVHRKEAQEYIHRREKRRKRKLQDEKSDSEVSPEKLKKTDEVTRMLNKARMILQKVVLKTKEQEKDSDEDDEYFSDVSEETVT